MSFWMPDRDELVEKCDYETKLAVTAWVMENIVAHATEGGSYRFLIYERLGFNQDAYAVLQEAGGLDISNEFSIGEAERIRQCLEKHKVETPPELKKLVGMCDEPGCYKAWSHGWPAGTSDMPYRQTCADHYVDKEQR